MKALVFSIAALFLSEPIDAVADRLPSGFEQHVLSGPIKATTTAGITTFHVEEARCSRRDYGDGRGENDCLNGNVKSTIRKTRNQRLGQSLEYRFDLWVDPKFSYSGFYNDHSIGFRPSAWDSRLRIASWEGQFIRDFIYILKLDSTSGVTFMAKTCQEPREFGQWVAFSFKVRWTKDKTGWAVARCNGRIIYSQEGIATNQQSQCYITNECEPGVVHNPPSINYVLGLALNGFGPEYKKYGYRSPFTAIPGDSGLTIKMRNIAVVEGAEPYDDEDRATVKQLQELLNSLGCDVGTPDGVAGQRTKSMALSCRQFAPKEAPEQLNVGTAGDFLALYRRTARQAPEP